MLDGPSGPQKISGTEGSMYVCNIFNFFFSQARGREHIHIQMMYTYMLPSAHGQTMIQSGRKAAAQAAEKGTQPTAPCRLHRTARGRMFSAMRPAR